MDIVRNSVYIVGWPEKTGFTIGKPINAKMLVGAEICARDPIKFSNDSHDAHLLMLNMMREQGLRVLDVEPEHGDGDSVFVRDPFCNIGGKIVLARFASETRRPEIENIRPIIKPEYIVELQNKESFLEGGDVIPTPFNLTFIAWGPRTSFAAIEELKGLFPNENFVPLEMREGHYDGTEASLAKAEFIHGDCGLSSLEGGELAIHRPAFVEKAWKLAEEITRDNGGDVYNLDRGEALNLCPNLKNLPCRTLLSPLMDTEDTGHSFKYWLRNRGYEVFRLPLQNFILADGCANCLVHEVPYHMLTPLARDMLKRQTPRWISERTIAA